MALPEALKEETKLTATFLNGIALAMLSFGLSVRWWPTSTAVSSPPTLEVVTLGPLWLLGTVAMHYTAVGVLKDMNQ